MVHRHTEHLAQIFGSDPLHIAIPSHHLLGTIAHQVADTAFQVTHASLTSIVVDDVHHNVFRKADLFGVQTVFRHLLRNQVTLGDFILFLTQVTAQIDDFHTVAQGWMDGGEIVGSSNKQHLRQVIIQFYEIIVKGIVLFRIEDFKQGSLGVAADVVATHLVDFIEDEDGVTRLHLPQVLYDTAWHGTDISLSVTSQLRFVAHATQ